MGLLGLKHLLYFATHYTVVLRGMMEAQAENNDTYYPIAVAGINLSKLLYEMFRSEDKQTMILFDHEHAVPEVRNFGENWLKFVDLLYCVAVF